MKENINNVMLKQKLFIWGVVFAATGTLWSAVSYSEAKAYSPSSEVQYAYATSLNDEVQLLAQRGENTPKTSKDSGKERKGRKNFTSKRQRNKMAQEREGHDTQVDFIDSEDGYWNARGGNAPQFGDGGSINSVMFENRPGRRVKELPSGPVRNSDVEVTGGKSTEITVNGRPVHLDKAKDKKTER